MKELQICSYLLSWHYFFRKLDQFCCDMYHILHLSVFWWWFLTCPFILCTSYKSKLVSNLILKLNQTHIKHIWQDYFINNAEYFILHIHIRNRWCQIVPNFSDTKFVQLVEMMSRRSLIIYSPFNISKQTLGWCFSIIKF